MPLTVTMPALSPTMETGTLAKWHVAVGDRVKSGDIIAEIETDKATMEFEAIDEGRVTALLVVEGSENVPVGTAILQLADEGEGTAPTPAAGPPAAIPTPATTARINATPLARRIAARQGVDLASLTGSGPHGRIIRADIHAAASQPISLLQQPDTILPQTATAPTPGATTPALGATMSPPGATVPPPPTTDIPHGIQKLSAVRKIIARRLTEAKQTIPHIYLTLDVDLDALLELRASLNAALAPRGIKISVNDLIIKALALALRQVPACNVSFAGDNLIVYDRADISVAVAAPSGLITPIITAADTKSLSQIANEMKILAEKARTGKLQPQDYQGGTASLSNLGMFGIRQFDAVINPPQAMILAVGAGEHRAVVRDGALAVATVMTITGSFDHRAIDGADGANLMSAIKQLLEQPLGLVA